VVAAQQDQQREPPPESAISGEGRGAEHIAGLELHDAGDDLGGAAERHGQRDDHRLAGHRQQAGIDAAEKNCRKSEPDQAKRCGVCRVCHALLPLCCSCAGSLCGF